MKRILTPQTRISVVAPVYNEVDCVEPFAHEIMEVFARLAFPGTLELVLVDDGSSDGSADRLDALVERSPCEVKVVHLARNFGHAPAVSAGLDHACGDAVILMDSDLQDDPVAFEGFLKKWQEGFDVVYAQRAGRKENAVKRGFFWLFYRMLGWMADVKLPADAGNFALMDRCVVEQLRSFPERNRYLPGLRCWIGFRQTGVLVPRRARHDHSTRVGLRGLWKLAMNAVFSFSYVPILAFRILGVLSMLLSLGLIAYAFYSKLFSGRAVSAWASQMVSVSFFSGVNLIGISIIGEYVARIYDEVKARPHYIVGKITSSVRVTPFENHRGPWGGALS